MKKLAIIIPCCNEEETLPRTNRLLLQLLNGLIAAGKAREDSCLCYVDDGSRDRTWPLIAQYAEENRHVTGIRLSRNFGHQNALLAGLFTVDSDYFITVDADLQDDINAMDQMLVEASKGIDIVYGVRDDRATDSPFKRLSAELFYAILLKLGVEVVYNHADYRLMSRRAVDALKEFKEVNLFLRGIIPMLGFSSTTVAYKRQQRLAGVSKYGFRKMLALALNGIVSTSVAPLRLVALTGILVFFLTIMLCIAVLFLRFCTDRAIPGWASTLLPICFLGGIQIISIGILGEYLGKLVTEVKARPRYIIDQKCGDKRELAASKQAQDLFDQ